MKVIKVIGIKCPECEAFVTKEDIPMTQDYFQCGECFEYYDDRDEAKDCCKM